MANTLISYNGKNTYYNNDSTSPSMVTGARYLYLNEGFAVTFYNCKNLKINISNLPFDYKYVTSMYNAYYNCSNITGNPVCGNNVTNMYYTYCNCYNLTGSPVCGKNVTKMLSTYSRCPNLYGTMYMNYTGNTMSSKVNAYCCFNGRNNLNRLNIYVPKGYSWDNWIRNVGKLCSSTALTWTKMTNGYYNTMYNIYVYNNVII